MPPDIAHAAPNSTTFPAATRPMRHILITGASSGLGAALARGYAAPDVILTLCGRDATRLNEIATDCRNRGATVATAEFDLRNANDLNQRVQEFDRRAPIDMAVLNAGLGGSIP